MSYKTVKISKNKAMVIEFTGISSMVLTLVKSVSGVTMLSEEFDISLISDNSKKLYDKWQKRFEELILRETPNFNDTHLKQLLNLKYPDSGYSVLNGNRYELEPKLCASSDKDVFAWFYGIAKADKNLPSNCLASKYAQYTVSVFDRCNNGSFIASSVTLNKLYEKCGAFLQYFRPRYDTDYVKSMATKGTEGKITIEDVRGNQVSPFACRLYYDLLDLKNFFDEIGIGDATRTDFEDVSGFDLLDSAYLFPEYDLSGFEPDGYTDEYRYTDTTSSASDFIDYVYNLSYKASLNYLSRVSGTDNIDFAMFYNFNILDNGDYYLPIGDDEILKKWSEDLDKHAFYPLALKVVVVESGNSRKRMDTYLIDDKEVNHVDMVIKGKINR